MEISKRPGRWKARRARQPDRGRKPGSGEVVKLRAAMAEHVCEIGAARLLLERTIAPLKASEEAASLTLPDGTLTQQGRAVLVAVAAGELAPGQGAALLASLGTLAKLTETDELTTRIEVLERRKLTV